MSETAFYLYLGGYAFDPLEGEQELPSELREEKAPEKAAYYVIQFAESLTQEERARIRRSYGLRLSDYVARLAFLEKVRPETLEALSKEPIFRASVRYQPAFKVSPAIGQLEFRTEERRAVEGLWLRAVLFSDADPTAVAAAIIETGASDIVVLDDREIGGEGRVRFVLSSKESLPGIARLEEVRWIEEVAEMVDDNVNTAGTVQSGTAGTEPVWDQGLHGEEQIIGILDSAPLDREHCYFEDSVDNTPGPGHRKVVDLRNASGSAAGGHATFVAGCAAGDDFNNPGAADRRGGAWASRLVSGNRRDLSMNTLLQELNMAAEAGATIHSNSWHDNTEGKGQPATYNQTAADVDTFTWRMEDHLVLGSAGNIGEEQGPPGTAKNAICVGASQADPNEMNYGDGNDGPTADGRRKPDLITPGCGIESATVDTPCGTGPRVPCATSYATPHTAAAAALARQYYTEGWYPSGARQPDRAFVPSGALLKATLINSTIDMTGIAGYPSDREGWGLVRLNRVLFFPGGARKIRVWDIRHAEGLTTGESNTHHVDVASNAQPLKVTLVWTEPPGNAGSERPVVNNLDLVVSSPDGTQTYIGNDFNGGASVPNSGAAADRLNNVEMALINNPAPGQWAIKVVGTEVNVGNPGQGYAVVASADVAEAVAPAAFQYAVKFICGKSAGNLLARGTYHTAINVHNPWPRAVKFRKRIAIACPLERPGEVTRFFGAALGKYEALEIDCQDIYRHTRDIHICGRRAAPFRKGFVVIESDVELDIVAVYTAADVFGRVTTMDIERVPPRCLEVGQPDLVPVPDPQFGFCNLVREGPDKGKLRVIVKNQGDADAPASTTRVTFSTSGGDVVVDLRTPVLEIGASVELGPLELPRGCHIPDCHFVIAVDADGEIVESDEGNNLASGTCLG
jgi:hypothetical protein